MIPTTVDLLLDWDSQRPRSRQKELGMSALGGCRRAAGYRLAGYPAANGLSSIQAVMGTAIHEVAAQAAGSIPGAQAENLEVRFGGLLGHPDLYVEPIVRDVKTTGRSSMLESWKSKGPPLNHQWQVNCYGAGLILQGYRVTTVQLDIIARDSGETWLWEAPFNVEAVRDAMNWLNYVRQTEVQFLPRDFRPESVNCRNCPFRQPCWGEGVPGRSPRTVLFRDEPDAAAWALRLEDARMRKAQAAIDEEDARGALDALRPDEVPKGGTDVEVPGLPRVLRFTRVEGRRKPDMPRITDDYARVGATVPMTQGDPTFRLSLLEKEQDDGDTRGP